LYPDGKNCAVPVLHRDYFVAKDEAQWPALRQVTPTNFIAGPLGLRDVATSRDSQRTKARVWLTPNTCFFTSP